MKKRPLLASLLTLILLLAFFSVALAKKPVVEIAESDIPFSLVCDEGETSEFTVEFDEHAVRRFTTFFDKDGNPEKLNINVKIRGTATNMDTETVFSSFAQLNETFELPAHPDNVVTLKGIIWKLQLPGGGIVVFDVGKLVFDESGNFISFSGHTEPEFTSDDFTLICDGVRGI